MVLTKMWKSVIILENYAFLHFNLTNCVKSCIINVLNDAYAIFLSCARFAGVQKTDLTPFCKSVTIVEVISQNHLVFGFDDTWGELNRPG